MDAAPSDASRNRTLPGWQRWMLPHRMLLGTGRYQVGSGGCSPHRMLLGTGRYQVGSGGCSPHRMLLGTGRCQVGSGGCSPHRMLLGTGRYQVGSGRCSPHRIRLRMNMILLRRWMLFALAASRKRSSPRNACASSIFRPCHVQKVQFVPRRPRPAERAKTA